jgi:hypothetical protein
MEEVIKLKAIKKRVEAIADAWHSTVPGADINSIIEQFSKIKSVVADKYPNVFDDFVPQDYNRDKRGDGYARMVVKAICADIDYYIEILEGISTPEVSNFKLSKEGIYFSGQYFDALYKIGEIIAGASKEVILIDGYINDKILEVFKAKNTTADLKVLTDKKSVNSSLETFITAFKKQYGNVEVKTSSAFHDRFLIIDRKDFYHFGASLKDAGNKGFMFSVIEEDFIKTNLLAEFDKAWT